MRELYTRPNMVSFLVDIKFYNVNFLIDLSNLDLEMMISNNEEFENYIFNF